MATESSDKHFDFPKIRKCWKIKDEDVECPSILPVWFLRPPIQLELATVVKGPVTAHKSLLGSLRILYIRKIFEKVAEGAPHRGNRDRAKVPQFSVWGVLRHFLRVGFGIFGFSAFQIFSNRTEQTSQILARVIKADSNATRETWCRSLFPNYSLGVPTKCDSNLNYVQIDQYLRWLNTGCLYCFLCLFEMEMISVFLINGRIYKIITFIWI